jgi:hypothetical protein
MHRNRLESNAEHWNALLLSLRELIEWVIRKDTELTGLGPIGGDVACLQKQQVRAMKHVIFFFCHGMCVLVCVLPLRKRPELLGIHSRSHSHIF